jgi:hypothetical protein
MCLRSSHVQFGRALGGARAAAAAASRVVLPDLAHTRCTWHCEEKPQAVRCGVLIITLRKTYILVEHARIGVCARVQCVPALTDMRPYMSPRTMCFLPQAQGGGTFAHVQRVIPYADVQDLG